MRRFAIAAVLLATSAQAATPELTRLKAEAACVTITRDTWGIAHVAGKTDADAVFGAIYAQAEDDFNRIEMNYLTNLGRLGEAEGEAGMWSDLRQRLWIDPVKLQADYRASPPWLRTLMDAWADGLNYYLATHPNVHPKVLSHFEPWMALSFTEGSIGADIEHVSAPDIAAFYGKTKIALNDEEKGLVYREPRGSNGIAIAAKNTANGHALLLINPHTSFYFRAVLQMTSGEGLNAYGASTWGQFFIYQGFNPNVGWMHTTSGVDNLDLFEETIVHRGGKLFYRYGKAMRPVTIVPITLRYRLPDGAMATRSFTTYRTHHGPIVASKDDKWVAASLMWRPVAALQQSYLRTKASDLSSYLKVTQFAANSSNNTLFADSKGDIAFLVPQFTPLRDNRFDYGKPVDGSDPATDWKGVTPFAALPKVINPASGFAFNVNDWPWSASGPDSPKQKDFPHYMDQVGENPRGVHADLLLNGKSGWTAPRLIAAAYDSYLPAFAELIPVLIADYAALPEGDPRRARLADPIALLRGWDDRWGADSEATSLAVFWGEALIRAYGPTAAKRQMGALDYARTGADGDGRLSALTAAIDRLSADFGPWRVPWGEINRFQRLDDAIAPHFDDARPSIPVPFTSSAWGSLASFGAHSYPNTKRYYGTNGNSFVAVVEFGPRVKAWAVTAGGESGDGASPHFADQAQAYAAGALQPVYFYPDDIAAHTERRYRPGE